MTANGTSLRASDGRFTFHITILENLFVSFIYNVVEEEEEEDDAVGSALTFHLVQTTGSDYATCEGNARLCVSSVKSVRVLHVKPTSFISG
jgi:hypothetical protein